MKKRYDELKEYRNILLNYDEILLFYPDYFKTKVQLENESFVSKEDVDKEFEMNYKDSKLYKKVARLAMVEDEIYQFMKHTKDLKYTSFKSIFDKLVQSSIDLCELIDYIGHYEELKEKNSKMEELLKKYDIVVRYYFGDIDWMQIHSDDIIRIIEKLQQNLEMIHSIHEKISTNDWLFTRKATDADILEHNKIMISLINDFPLSLRQEQEKLEQEKKTKNLTL